MDNLAQIRLHLLQQIASNINLEKNLDLIESFEH